MNEVTNEPILSKLEQRLGRLHARQRLGIERDHEAQIFGQGINFFILRTGLLTAWHRRQCSRHQAFGGSLGCRIRYGRLF
jgi:hypothetical protein